MDKCPCKNCICQAICKPKNFVDLILDCELIDTFTEDHTDERMRRRVGQVYRCLKPSGWRPIQTLLDS